MVTTKLHHGIPTIDQVREHVNSNRHEFLLVKEALRMYAAGELTGPMPRNLAMMASQLAVAILHHVLTLDAGKDAG